MVLNIFKAYSEAFVGMNLLSKYCCSWTRRNHDRILFKLSFYSVVKILTIMNINMFP